MLIRRSDPNKHKLVVAWIEIHQDDLLADLNLAVIGKTVLQSENLTMTIVESQAQANWLLFIVADDGPVGRIDVSPYSSV